MRRRYLGLLALMVASPLLAASNAHQFNVRLCHNIRHLDRGLWQHGLYATSPTVAHAMLFAVDGDTAKLRKALAAMPPKAAQQWRQAALGFAALDGRTDTVEALLDDGAKPDAWGYEPPLRSTFFKRVIGDAKRDPRLGGAKGVVGFQKAGLIDNQPRRVAPAMIVVVQCDDLATAKVLLRHQVDPMHRIRPHGADPFMMAVLDGQADITRLFLEHGASPCVEDARIAANSQRHPIPTVASIGKDEGLPAALVKRLTCPAAQSHDSSGTGAAGN
jgi:hypothetical protein